MSLHKDSNAGTMWPSLGPFQFVSNHKKHSSHFVTPIHIGISAWIPPVQREWYLCCPVHTSLLEWIQ
jgi:hypothetical protein